MVVSLGLSMPARAETKLTIVALGDSTTAGTPYFLSPAEDPPEGSGIREAPYTYWMMKSRPSWNVINRGVNGQRSGEILGRFESDVLPYKPDLLIVLAGVNDLYQGYPARVVQENLQRIYEKAGSNGISVMACTIIPYNGMNAGARSRMKEVNDWIRNYSAENRIGFCDLFAAAEDPENPFHLAGTEDGLHPDRDTYRKMGEALVEAVERRPGFKAVEEGLSPPGG